MKAKVSGNWKDTKPWVKVSGSWKPVSTGWVKVGGKWKVMYTAGLVVDVPTGLNFNLWEHLGQTMPKEENIIVRIPPNTGVQSYDATKPAFKLGNPFSGKIITIENKGSIQGAAGVGGVGTTSLTTYPDGGPGGDGLDVSEAQGTVTLANYSYIGGGGGGGGAGESQQSNQGGESHLLYAGGNGGWGRGAMAKWMKPQGDEGIAFKVRQGRVSARSGHGGSGGSAGKPGSPGGEGTRYFTRHGNAGRGGAAGNAIKGVSKLTITDTGTGRIEGPQIG